MELLIFAFLFNLIVNVDGGNFGIYEVQIINQEGEIYNGYLNVATYVELKTDFETDKEFKDFILGLDFFRSQKELEVYLKTYSISNPEINCLEEGVAYFIEEDMKKILKANIKTFRYKSFERRDPVFIRNKLTEKDIDLLNTKPIFLEEYSLDREQEGYTKMWMISYNNEIRSKEFREIEKLLTKEYTDKIEAADYKRNSWIYEEVINKWDYELRVQGIYLMRIIVV